MVPAQDVGIPRATRTATGEGMALTPLTAQRTEQGTAYSYVTVAVDTSRRLAEITMKAPAGPTPETPEALRAAGCAQWHVAAWRELDDALLLLDDVDGVAVSGAHDR